VTKAGLIVKSAWGIFVEEEVLSDYWPVNYSKSLPRHFEQWVFLANHGAKRRTCD
jgi:hypothetical protein